jgi:hypothetical protein
MKKIIILATACLLTAIQCFSQCSSTPNNFELRLLHQPNSTLKIQLRYHKNAVANAISILPENSMSLDGLIFAIACPVTSNAAISRCVSPTKPFNVLIDSNTQSVRQNKNAIDRIVTFYHSTDFPAAFADQWHDNQWIDIATIQYTGELGKGEYFSLVDCDYGIAHPNSYSGNSHTDAWLAFINLATSEYQQYSPALITEMPPTISSASLYNIYPNPTNGVMYVELQTEIQSQVMLQVTDITGKFIMQQQVEVVPGTNKYSVDLKHLAAGSYVANITDGKTLHYNQKIQKL